MALCMLDRNSSPEVNLHLSTLMSLKLDCSCPFCHLLLWPHLCSDILEQLEPECPSPAPEFHSALLPNVWLYLHKIAITSKANFKCGTVSQTILSFDPLLGEFTELSCVWWHMPAIPDVYSKLKHSLSESREKREEGDS